MSHTLLNPADHECSVCATDCKQCIADGKAPFVSERLLRREAVENSIADLRLEGLAPTADAQLLFEQFVQGELTEEQLVNAILAR